LKGPITLSPHAWKGQDNMLGWSNCGFWWMNIHVFDKLSKL